jgi:hypothetical protein
MMKSAILASLVASAAAFAPAQTGRASVAAKAFDGEVGAQAPLGYFDPLGLCTEEGDREKFEHLREVEIRHGRVSMLAVTGWLTTAAGIRLPGMEEVGFGFKALDVSALPMDVRGTVPFTLGTVAVLSYAMRDVTGNSDFAGDYRNNIDFGWDSQSDAWKDKKRSVELNNGRAAQMGILGIMVHEQLGNLGSIGLPTP